MTKHDKIYWSVVAIICLIAAMVPFFIALADNPDECLTDYECQVECLLTLPPNRPESECDV